MGRSTATPVAKPAPKPSTVAYRNHEGHRDTIEAVVVALILALVVRGFEAQAFVIPTGSMAPTLMGRHKEVACEQCGFTFAVNASEEVESHPPRDVYSGLCGNCRHTARLNTSPSFKGDRILVMMFPYDLPFLPGSRPPERFDVVVFRYPEEPEVSYIKRLIGLPDETIRITHGDVFVKKQGSQSFALARKPLRHQTAMQINVYDDRHQPRAFSETPEWRRWRGDGAGWKVIDPGKSRYQIDSAADTLVASAPSQRELGNQRTRQAVDLGIRPSEWAELRYRNLVPDPEQWQAVLSQQPLPREPRPTLITDFYSYNTTTSVDPTNPLDEPRGDQDAWMQPHWVGDLTLEANLEVGKVSAGGSVRFELIEAGVAHRCSIDLESGAAVFTRGDSELGRAQSPITGPGRHQIVFANVDDRISLIVDGKPVGGEGFEYTVDESAPIPTEKDLAPVAVAARNASIVASDLVVKRDIYYTQNPGRIDYGLVWEDRYPRTPVELFDFLADPTRFANLAKIGSHEYEVGSDRYFMLGDNSPRSKDSRGWGLDDSAWDPGDRKSWEVPRQLVTGKAFYVYWPHGKPVGPDLPITRDIRPFFRPYFERMKWIR